MAKFRTTEMEGGGFGVMVQKRSGDWSTIVAGLATAENAWVWAVGAGFKPHPLFEPAIGDGCVLHACAHESIPTNDGHGAFCRHCGEALA